MNIEDLTYGEMKKINNLFNSNANATTQDSLDFGIGDKVIIRTYSAGVWFGTLHEKQKGEVILKNARRMWRWTAAESISLSGVAKYGIKQDGSKICPPVAGVWLEAIEILELTAIAINSIEGAKDVLPE